MASLIVVWLILASAVTLPMVLLLCVCHGRGKQKHPNSKMLPLNSMRNGDLPNLELISFNPNISMAALDETDSSRNKHLTFNRALPDIPSTDQTDSSCQILTNKTDQLVQSPVKRSTKQRAPQPPVIVNHDSFSQSQASKSSPTVVHHPYARIKDKTVIDSSTENDTDDYCDPQTCTGTSNYFVLTKTLSDSETELGVPPVPAKRFAGPESANNSRYLFDEFPSTSSASHAVAGRVPSNEIPYMTPPPRLDDDAASESSIGTGMPRKKEISYNTISVREPLAKVLAEHAQSEHQYIEVEDEQISSFYEEIHSGSATSSVTYSKIGYATKAEAQMENFPETSQEPPALPSLESLMIAAESIRNTSPPSRNFSSSPRNQMHTQDLYSSVVKTKKQAEESPTSNDLYAKVQKSPNQMNSEPSTSSGFRSLMSNTPPPLPPPLNMSQHPKTRTISMYDSSSNNFAPEIPQRRFSFGLLNHGSNEPDSGRIFSANSYSPVEQDDNDGSDAGYEMIQKRQISEEIRAKDPRIQSLPNGCSGFDPGYEAIIYDESDNDPAYETISKRVVKKDSESSEPGYELIKRARPFSSPTLPKVSTGSDHSSESGYERVVYSSKRIESDSEPPYASIKKNDDGDDDDDERLTERL